MTPSFVGYDELDDHFQLPDDETPLIEVTEDEDMKSNSKMIDL